MRTEFLNAYIECAIWSSIDDKGEPLDRLELELSASAREKMVADCDAFQAENSELLARAYEEGMSISQAGHDFWLTRNGHGAGFWDRDLSTELGQALTDAAHKCGERQLYVSDLNELEIE